ncbi:MAG: DNRLRE domain-containing protein [bacterium]
MKKWVFVLVCVFLQFQYVQAEIVSIEASRDTTLIEDPAGAFSNGSGPVFFVGRTNQVFDSIRRGLLYFDVAAAIPENTVIESVSLTLYQDRGNPALSVVSLQRVLDGWGEGASAASGGGGALSQPGDATWIHTFYDYAFWNHEGGQFVGRVSAWQYVEGDGYYVWESTDDLVKDVQRWLGNPDKNFGWVLIGDEDNPQTVKRFASRENLTTSLRPLLNVSYRLP